MRPHPAATWSPKRRHRGNTPAHGTYPRPQRSKEHQVVVRHGVGGEEGFAWPASGQGLGSVRHVPQPPRQRALTGDHQSLNLPVAIAAEAVLAQDNHIVLVQFLGNGWTGQQGLGESARGEQATTHLEAIGQQRHMKGIKGRPGEPSPTRARVVAHIQAINDNVERGILDNKRSLRGAGETSR